MSNPAHVNTDAASTQQPTQRDPLWDYLQCRIMDVDECIGEHKARIAEEEAKRAFYWRQVEALLPRVITSDLPSATCVHTPDGRVRFDRSAYTDNRDIFVDALD